MRTRRNQSERWRHAFGLVALVVACRPTEVATPAVDRTQRHDRALTPAQAEYLATLASRADHEPDNRAARKASGMAHLRFTLSGVLSLQARAEDDLEAAFRLDRGDPELNRTLGRFYNLRAVVGDDSKAEQQVDVYGALLADQEVGTMDSRHFAAWAFFQLGRVLTQKKRGRLLEALETVKQLERALEERTRKTPLDVEMFALAGNFAFFFAGNIPMSRRERVEQAVKYFEVLRLHWDDLRYGARDEEHCPNTYENFMFELAEGYTVLGKTGPAAEIYGELTNIRGTRTRAKEIVAYVAQERLRNHERYVGQMDLMPPWPSDVGNCVVCHAYTSEVPLTSLHSIEPLSLLDIPSQAISKPVEPTGGVPEPVRASIDAHCVPCHRRGGEAEAEADFTFDEAILVRSSAIARRVEAGEMPPDAALPPTDRDVLLRWAGATGANASQTQEP